MKLSKFSDREIALIRESLGNRAEHLELLIKQLEAADRNYHRLKQYRQTAKECWDLFERLPPPKQDAKS